VTLRGSGNASLPVGSGGRAALGFLHWPVLVFARFGALPLLLVGMIIYFDARTPILLSRGNLTDVLSEGLYLLLIATGQAIVLISGGFDLSVSSNVALTSVSTATLMTHMSHSSQATASLAAAGLAIGVGVAIGLANGIGVAVFRVNPFIMTLASSSVIAGLTLRVSSQEISGLPTSFVNDLGFRNILGIPSATYVVVPIVALVFLVTKVTRFGRYVYAVGSNQRAARLSGVGMTRVLISAYVLCAVLTAVSGFLLTARVATGEPLLGGEYLLQSITAAVIGGVSLRGGEGGIGGTVVGVAFVVFLGNGMNLIRLGSDQEMIALGIVLALAVTLDRQRQNARAFVLRRRYQQGLRQQQAATSDGSTDNTSEQQARGDSASTPQG
jgi:ribose transport system permease protein